MTPYSDFDFLYSHPRHFGSQSTLFSNPFLKHCSVSSTYSVLDVIIGAALLNGLRRI